MNEAQAREILQGKFKVTINCDENSSARDRNYQNFHRRIINLVNELCVSNVIFKAKLKLITDIGVNISIWPMGITADKSIGGSCGVAAAFNAPPPKIHIFPVQCFDYSDKYMSCILSHEVEHAFKFVVHSIRSQNTPSPITRHTMPFYPASVEEEKIFSEKILIGDQRFVEFHELLKKEQIDSASLTDNENQKLTKYKSVASLHFPRERCLFFNKSKPAGKALLENNSENIINTRKASMIYDVPTKHGIVAAFRVTWIENHEDTFACKGYYTAKDAKEFNEQVRMHALIYEVLMRDMIHMTSEEELLPEQHARTVGELSLPILECFYPEVLAYDNNDIAEALAIRRMSLQSSSSAVTTSITSAASQAAVSAAVITASTAAAAAAAISTTAATSAAVPQAQLHGNMFKAPLSTQEMDRMIKTRSVLLKLIVPLLGTTDADGKIRDAIKEENYNLALRRACAAGNIKAVQLLIDKNKPGQLALDFNEASSNGKTSLDWATAPGNDELVALLERHGAKKGSASESSVASGPK